MFKNYNFKILIFSLLLITMIFFIVLALLYKINYKKNILVEIEINNQNQMNFKINSNLYYEINKNSKILIEQKYAKNNENFYLKIKEIKNIKNDVFNVVLFHSTNLKIKPNTRILGKIILSQKSNIFDFIFH
ncbi:Uncharacterised protein [Mesomycoplasma neurolyticum]|uniref:Uncharacterized protein n=2 Tax=Mesomycoplasma neurolyticum TaxID=2120 RepID=A0A449A4M1_9BACT|nr:Uncharacterised protein [Mesomycoplasma neurolyticum]